MTPQCIHGFRTDECASCQSCPHGLTMARCGRCAAATASTRRAIPAAVPQASEEYAGFEIFYDPAVSGWYYRATEGATASSQSYRSAFLARKAVDRVASESRS